MLDEKKYKTKTYIHFDHRVKIGNVESYVTDKAKISVHSFLPLIHYEISFDKFNQKKYQNEELVFLDTKIRDIKYAGHLDNFIYKYYSETIQDEFYNQWCLDNNLDNCILAYRNNKPGQSNIHFAAEVVSKIVEMEEAYVLVGDFTKYFDQINHIKLKNNVREILGVEKLKPDWFNVYQSVTRYGYFNKTLLDSIYGDTKELKRKNQKSYFNQLSDFRKFKSKYKKELKANKSGIGIPQGTAISATFANIYSLNFDKSLNELALSHGGIYRRYSDDFIVVLPKGKFKKIEEFFELERVVRLRAEKEGIEIQERKTGIFEYSNRMIKNLSTNEQDHLDYLGFVFDGTSVQMRGKGSYKFYRKASKLLLKAKKTQEKKNLKKLPYRKALFKLYTDLGINDGHGNYISYAKRSQEVFDRESPDTINLMINQIKNRKRFIEKKLGVKLSIKI